MPKSLTFSEATKILSSQSSRVQGSMTFQVKFTELWCSCHTCNCTFTCWMMLRARSLKMLSSTRFLRSSPWLRSTISFYWNKVMLSRWSCFSVPWFLWSYILSMWLLSLFFDTMQRFSMKDSINSLGALTLRLIYTLLYLFNSSLHF